MSQEPSPSTVEDTDVAPEIMAAALRKAEELEAENDDHA